MNHIDECVDGASSNLCSKKNCSVFVPALLFELGLLKNHLNEFFCEINPKLVVTKFNVELLLPSLSPSPNNTEI